MQLTVRFSGGKRSDFGDHDYEGVLRDSLARFQYGLKQVCLYVEDVNGPRGGVDKQCRCVLHLRRQPPIVIKDEGDNMQSLLYRVANRASYALSQKVDRKSKRAKRKRMERKQALASVGESWDNEVRDDFDASYAIRQIDEVAIHDAGSPYRLPAV